MRRLLHSVIFITLAFLGTLTTQTYAQCLVISGLPDTIDVCKNNKTTLTATVTSPIGGPIRALDTFWTPTTNLTNPNIITTVANMGSTSQLYVLNVPALTSNNYVANGTFDSTNALWFNTAYIPGTGGAWGLLSNEGQYAISTNPNLTHTNFASFPDHTGNLGGKMMVVNGASVANTSVWCQTISVTPNTQYDFSAWGASCVNSSPAILQFSINNTLIGAPLSLPTTTGQWVQFHITWNSGSNTSITICIVDQQTAPSGNDFAIDDIEFRQICLAQDSVYVRVTNLVPKIDTLVMRGCDKDSVKFTAVNNGDVASSYSWDFGDGFYSALQNPTHTYNTQGVYTIKLVTTLRGCRDSTTINVDTRHPISASLKVDKDTICLGETSTFDNSGDQTTTTASYYYDFGDGGIDFTSNPTHKYNAIGTYKVFHVVSDKVPCTDTAWTEVTVIDQPVVNATVSPTSICEGEKVDFTITLEPGYDTLLWDFGDGSTLLNQFTNTSRAYYQSGTYSPSVTVSYAACPNITIPLSVLVNPTPKVNLGLDTSICPNGSPIRLANSAYNNYVTSNEWSNGETGNNISISSPNTYWLVVKSDKSCVGSDSITVKDACYLDIPNAFSPNNDGNHDYFFPRNLLSSRLQYFNMQIFDRWGQKIFETKSLDGRGWDGKFNGTPMPQGVYVYIIDAKLENTGIMQFKGNVTLLR